MNNKQAVLQSVFDYLLLNSLDRDP